MRVQIGLAGASRKKRFSFASGNARPTSGQVEKRPTDPVMQPGAAPRLYLVPNDSEGVAPAGPRPAGLTSASITQSPMHRLLTDGMARTFARAGLGLSLMLLAGGCNHAEAFSDGSNPPRGPRTTTPPIQLTYDGGDDLTPAWLPDGSGIGYTWTGSPDHNRCLGILPPAGGTRHNEKCWRSDLLGDSISSINWVSVGPDGRAAWVDQVGKRVRLPPDRSAIRVGQLLTSDTGVAVRTFLYLAPSGNLHMTATSLTWLGSTSLAYVAGAQDFPRPCGNCEADTVITGIEVAVLDLTQTPAGVTIVPNTAGANSLLATPDGRTIYYTLNNDTRVIQQVLASGDTATLYDFASLGHGFPTDISMGGGFLAATLGPGFGSGGEIVRVNLTGGAPEVVQADTGGVIRGRISPDGGSMVVQLFDGSAPTQPPSMNLWLYHLP